MADVEERIEHHSTSNVDLSEVGIPVEGPAQINKITPDFGTLVCEDDGVHDGQQHLTVRVVADIDVEGSVFTADYAGEEDADLSGVDFDEPYTEVTRSQQAILVVQRRAHCQQRPGGQHRVLGGGKVVTDARAIEMK